MDLLEGALSKVTTARNGKRKKPGQDAARFKTDEETGKMLIAEDEDSDKDQPAAEDVEGVAYRETLTSVDGFTRGQGGKVKFHKDTKKRRRENEEPDGDVEMADGTGAPPKAKKKVEARFGHEFKAKKAGGDIKKGGVEPYAYISLKQAAKKRGKTGIAGKR